MPVATHDIGTNLMYLMAAIGAAASLIFVVLVAYAAYDYFTFRDSRSLIPEIDDRSGRDDEQVARDLRPQPSLGAVVRLDRRRTDRAVGRPVAPPSGLTAGATDESTAGLSERPAVSRQSIGWGRL